MAKKKAKSIKSVASGNPHKNIANVRLLHSRAPATTKHPPVNISDNKDFAFGQKEIRQELFISENYYEQIQETIKENTIKDIFLNSLRTFTQKDIILEREENRKNKKGEQLIANLMLVICAVVFIFSGYKLIEKMISYSEAAESNDSIRDIFYEEAEDAGSEFTKLKKSRRNQYSIELLKKMEAPKEAEGNESANDYEAAEVSELDKIRNKLQLLTAINPDTYGWINVSELNIDYPVVKTTNNDYYLKHNFYKVYQESGAIFADFRIDQNVLKNKNTIIYGHNMADGTMFENLLKYRYNKTLMENSVIELRTMDGIFVYKIFSVYVTDKYYPYIRTDFASDEDWLKFLTAINERSIHKTDIEFKSDDKIITLSTCTNTWDNRFAVHAILVEIRQ